MKYKTLNIITLITVIMILFSACAQPSGQASESEYIRITAEEAKLRIDKSDRAIIVDVRTQEEYDDGHIDGAVLIPVETIKDDMPEPLSDLDAEILIYCRSGNRSRQAAQKLIDMGYKNVFDFGGIIDWPYEIYKQE